MNKLKSRHESLTLFSAYQSETLALPAVAEQRLEAARRLIVLVSRLDADITSVTRRVWELANATGAHIQFLGLYSDQATELSLRRELATMSAMVKDGGVSAGVEVICGNDWVGVVRSRWQAGDMVVCFEEQRVGLSHKPLSQILQSNLDVPVYILSGLTPQNATRLSWPARAVAWIGFIAIIIGFFVLQVKIYHLAKDWTIAWELLSTAAEFWLIWIWNNQFG